MAVIVVFFFKKRRRLLTPLFIGLLFVPSSVAARNNILSLPGEVWGRVDFYNNRPVVGQFDFLQAVSFRAFPYLQPYVGATHFQQSGADPTTYTRYGVRNTTLLKPFVFGVEQQHYLRPSTLKDATVGYISLYKDWNLLE